MMSRAPLRDGSPGAAPSPVATREGAPADATTPAGSTPGTSGEASGAGATPAPAGDAAVATYATGSPRYDQAVAELEQALAAGRGRLEPRTLRILEENLRTIDRAIGDARRAVEADPANAWLREHLAATMKRKVDLLRTATMLAAARG
jgi:hypothetical protein